MPEARRFPSEFLLKTVFHVKHRAADSWFSHHDRDVDRKRMCSANPLRISPSNLGRPSVVGREIFRREAPLPISRHALTGETLPRPERAPIPATVGTSQW